MYYLALITSGLFILVGIFCRVIRGDFGTLDCQLVLKLPPSSSQHNIIKTNIFHLLLKSCIVQYFLQIVHYHFSVRFGGEGINITVDAERHMEGECSFSVKTFCRNTKAYKHNTIKTFSPSPSSSPSPMSPPTTVQNSEVLKRATSALFLLSCNVLISFQIFL